MILCLWLAILAAPYPEKEHERIQEIVQESELSSTVRDMAVAAGLQKKDANELTLDLGGNSAFPPSEEFVKYWESKESFALFPFLKGVIALPGLPFSSGRLLQPSSGSGCGLSRLTTLNWIAVCHDPESSEWLLKYVEARMKEPVRSRNDAKEISLLLKTLGYDGSNEALDILFCLQSKAVWDRDPPVEIQIHDNSSQSKEQATYEIRSAALSGIALSGTDRALHAFATGENIAADMIGLSQLNFHTAAHARVGIYFIDWHYRRGLKPEVEAALNSIYQEYGVEHARRGNFESDSTHRPPLSSQLLLP